MRLGTFTAVACDQSLVGNSHKLWPKKKKKKKGRRDKNNLTYKYRFLVS